MTIRDVVEIILAVSMPLCIITLFVIRALQGKYLSVRSIQMVVSILFMPTITILALEQVIDGAVVAALLGSFIGYLLSNFSEYDRKGRKNGQSQGQKEQDHKENRE